MSDDKQKSLITEEKIRWQEKEVGITAEWHEVEPPHEWFHVVMIAAREDVTKHEAIWNAPLHRVLVYVDAMIKSRTPEQTESDNG